MVPLLFSIAARAKDSAANSQVTRCNAYRPEEYCNTIMVYVHRYSGVLTLLVRFVRSDCKARSHENGRHRLVIYMYVSAYIHKSKI